MQVTIILKTSFVNDSITSSVYPCFILCVQNRRIELFRKLRE